MHWLVLQYCPERAQSVCCALPHAPCPLHTFALFRTVTLAHEAVEHAVSAPLYVHESDVPSQEPEQVASVAVHGVCPERGGPDATRVQAPLALQTWH